MAEHEHKTTCLRGMTWGHPRGIDPLVACAARWRAQTGVEIVWDARSLQDFESYPVQSLAEQYDLIVIDHPHVGQITREGCLEPLDLPQHEAAIREIAGGSVGASFESYRWDGRLWALPIDAAAQVQAWRPDALPGALHEWAAVRALAAEGRVLWPMRPPHNLMCLFTLCGQLGTSASLDGETLFAPSVAAEAYEHIREANASMSWGCYAMDPIAVLEAMVAPGSSLVCAPLIYGYANYARDGFRARRVAFGDIPVLGAAGVRGSALGGTGVAVSARTKYPQAARDFAYWVASSEVQRGPYAANGGQPAHAAAWSDPAVNIATHDFYRATRATLDGAWLRPRHDGYMTFQAQASVRLDEALQRGERALPVIAELNALYRGTLLS